MDWEGNADQYFDSQMLLLPPLPPPPRRSMLDSDSGSDSSAVGPGAGSVGPGAGAVGPGAGAVGPPGAGAFDEGDQVRRALEQFGQLRRQRFLRDQRHWHHATIPGVAGAGPSRGGPRSIAGQGEEVDDMTQPLFFPSNDVDSYWYNQPASEAPGWGGAVRRARPSDDDGLRGRRSPMAEASRRAMLGVLRSRHALEASSSSDSGSLGSLGELEGDGHGTDSASVPGSRRVSWQSFTEGDDADTSRSEKPETQDNGDDDENVMGGMEDSSGARPSGGRRGRHSSARVVEQRVMWWLIKNSVVQRDLSCALLRPGAKFKGIQKISPQTRDHIRANPYLSLPPTASLEKWDVRVEIQTVDMARGRVTGLMKAINVPRLPEAVVTCWEGEIIDFVNHMPLTSKWRATCADDTRHWSLFAAVRSRAEM
ncbi:hypothetical protein GGF46_001177 [Coemansia sp. RSA 552]|nr:hypothetical protein GGF46_001177 [Coemansia sp. RSA 552]